MLASEVGMGHWHAPHRDLERSVLHRAVFVEAVRALHGLLRLDRLHVQRQLPLVRRAAYATHTTSKLYSTRIASLGPDKNRVRSGVLV